MKKLVFMSLLASGGFSLSAENSSLVLPRRAPEAQGIPASAIFEFVKAADQQSDTTHAIHSFMLVRHGHVVAEGWWSPYAPEVPHKMFSLSKSFTSTAVGMAIAEGKLSLDDRVISFFPEDTPSNPSAYLKAMRVRDLLIMSNGQDSNTVAQLDLAMRDAARSGENIIKAFLAAPVACKPGTLFVYNTPGTYILSAIVQKVTGETEFDYLKPRFFEPLGIENPTWDASPQGVTWGGVGLNIRTEDIARFGLLYLQKGEWNGKQLLPAAWVETATTRQTSNGSEPTSDWDQGYGYLFWRCRHGFYRGDGAFGQFCIVMPQQDAVVAITSGTRDMQAVMNLVWNKLVPAMHASPLPADGESDQKLEHLLAGLTLHQPRGAATSPIAAQVSGRTYFFPTNAQDIDSVKFKFKGPETTLVVESLGHEYQIPCGSGVWEKGRTAFTAGAEDWIAAPVEQPVAASGAWTADDTYTVKLAYYETPLAVTLTCRFAGDHVLLLGVEQSVEFVPNTPPLLIGNAQ
ncbi:MAG TPA: serine hydrolase [Candidatus Saccharimonadales bacterium]|nr:serine hydrolase [Candidatus Saccharimonadales bacterium]